MNKQHTWLNYEFMQNKRAVIQDKIRKCRWWQFNKKNELNFKRRVKQDAYNIYVNAYYSKIRKEIFNLNV